MTLDQYINQLQPEYMPRVALKPSEYILGNKRTFRSGIEIIVHQEVYIKKYPGEYWIKVSNNPCLKTHDLDGNPKSSSCFYILEK